MALEKTKQAEKRGGIFSQRSFALVFALALLVQSGHMVEHLAQVVQKFIFHSPEAHGLIGQLDLEVVHYCFNSLYLILLGLVCYGWDSLRGEYPSRWRFFASLLLFALVVSHIMKWSTL